ncbi:exopolysaccharide biosynthesis polyprenyl glycosylphosphotransferase [Mongoliitalea daihaiensis]|uniref:exopolysaccharide biosynthesis polyprenyl glycosylphosphotransferase n=1 Tax=Mongoliitalea daihaiensis TaxID=2782006 RepID=UPI001F235036|nr:exopolysaccharide biosynthesis polyprenyl glycosylphosphotransferase [Mongoliitalea daihaiensis]UJP64866.1 exopolysaccharide biosynthesis polyprenyl glycosylphosphotransferase [Mongoliitalea daihaiensis]
MKTKKLSFVGFGDVISLTFVYLMIVSWVGLNNDTPTWMLSTIYIGLLFTWLSIAFSRDLYLIWGTDTQISVKFKKYFESYFILAGILGIVYLFISFPAEFRKFLVTFLVSFPLTVIFVHSLIYRFTSKVEEIRLKNSKILLAGSPNHAYKLESLFGKMENAKLRIKGIIDCGFEASDEKYETSLANLSTYVSQNDVNEIIVTLPLTEQDKINQIRKICDYEGIRFKYALNMEGLFGEKCKAQQFGDYQVINVRHVPLDNTAQMMMKDVFDIIFSSFALILTSPILLVVAILIKLESAGPVFYCPIRIGKNGEAFKLYKFRSMYVNDPASSGTNSTQKDDPRITRVGRFIRKCSLDELPQFINVLKGEMSVVGPRPHRVFLNNKMRDLSDQYMIRHYSKPGITGWAQVNGWRGPTETEEQITERTKHDLWYLKNWTFFLDVKIVWMTIFGSKTHKSAF